MSRPVVTTFIPALVGGGAERTVVTLLPAFADAGFTPRLVLLGPHVRAGNGLEFPVPDCAEVEVLNAPLRLCLPLLARHLRRNPPDVLVSHVTRHNVTAALARRLSGRRFPLLLVEHSTPSAEFGAGTREHRLIRRLMRATYPAAEALGAVAHLAAADLAEVAGVPDVVTLRNPLVPADLDRLAAEPTGHPWLDGPDPVVLGVGRLAAEKNWPYLVRALARLRRLEPRARLILVGTGPEEQAVREEARREGVEDAVDLAGFVANPYPWMRRAAVVSLASHYEGLPSVVVEALACGAPVVATASRGGIREALGGGRFGTLVPLDDEHAYAHALYEAIFRGGDPEAAAWARAGFGVAETTGRYVRLLERLVQGIAQAPVPAYGRDVGERAALEAAGD